MLPHQRRIIGITLIVQNQKTTGASGEIKIKWQDKATSASTNEPGPRLSLNIVMKLKPIFAELSDESLLEKWLHAKT